MTIEDSGFLSPEHLSTHAELDTIFSLFQNGRMLLVELDADSRIIRCNGGFAAASTRDPETLVGAFPPERLAARLAGAAAGLEPSPDNYREADREDWHSVPGAPRRVRWLKLWAGPGANAVRYLKFGVLEQPGPTGDQQGDQSQLEAFLDSVPDAIITIDDTGTIISVNHATQNLFGYAPDDMIGRNVSMLMASPDREQHDEYLARYLRTGDARVIGAGREVTARRPDGSTFRARLSISEFTSDNRRFFTGILHDITERIQLQEQQQAMFAEQAHASRVVALGEMASSIAHEINQPLTAIVSFADASRKLIESGRYDTETLDHALKQISEQGQRAGKIVRRLREFVTKKAPSRSTVDFNQVVRTAVALTSHDAERYGIALDLDLDPRPLTAEVDRLQIEQVILNLIRNSLEAINESGASDGRIRITSCLRDDIVTITVSDNGPGIKPSQYDDVFDAFYTTKESGTGLGLSISQSIVKAHDGTLSFQPNDDAGVVFTMALPTHEPG